MARQKKTAEMPVDNSRDRVEAKPRQRRAKTSTVLEPVSQGATALSKMLQEQIAQEQPAASRAEVKAEASTGKNLFEEQVTWIKVSAIDRHGANARRDMDPVDLEELQDSIERHGLLQPVVVEPIPGKTMGHRYRLVAGFRRMTAIKTLGWETVPVRVLRKPLQGVERVVLQMTENMQRENMPLRDIIESVTELQKAGYTYAQMQNVLGWHESTARLYGQLAEILNKYPKLWPFFEKNLISVEHFRVAHRLLTKVNKKAKESTTDLEVQAQIMDQAEQLFVAMLERVAQMQPLTIRRVSTEVGNMLTRIGIDTPKRTGPVKSGLQKALFVQFEHMDVHQMDKETCEAFLAIVQEKQTAAQERLQQLSLA